MRFAVFTHSLLSDWNHGNAHFLRGILTELISRGHQVTAYEPADAWSLQNLLQDRGPTAVEGFRRTYPLLNSVQYRLGELSLDLALEDVDVVLVHEWNAHELVAAIGEHRRRTGRYKLFFHDTHHRSVTDFEGMRAYDLSGYDGVLAFGEVIRQRYLEQGWARRAWTWHEAADPRVFHPRPNVDKEGDLVWVGNWGDDERTAELHEFLLEPVKALGLKATIYGVRYPDKARKALADAGIAYGGSLANYEAPKVFASHRFTVHVPRRPYVEALPGIPTIRVFEALACGIPLISAPWHDAEHLFTPGQDFLVAADGGEMKAQMRKLLNSPELASTVSQHGLATVLSKHTCAHRVDQLLGILGELKEEDEQREEVAAL